MHNVKNWTSFNLLLKYSRSQVASPMLQLQAPVPRWDIILMDIQFMAMPPTLLEQHWSLAGIQLIHLLTWCPSSPTTPQGILLELATWTMPMVTLLLPVMVMSWFQQITMHHITILEVSKDIPVDLLHR